MSDDRFGNSRRTFLAALAVGGGVLALPSTVAASIGRRQVKGDDHLLLVEHSGINSRPIISSVSLRSRLTETELSNLLWHVENGTPILVGGHMCLDGEGACPEVLIRWRKLPAWINSVKGFDLPEDFCERVHMQPRTSAVTDVLERMSETDVRAMVRSAAGHVEWAPYDAMSQNTENNGD